MAPRRLHLVPCRHIHIFCLPRRLQLYSRSRRPLPQGREESQFNSRQFRIFYTYDDGKMLEIIFSTPSQRKVVLSGGEREKGNCFEQTKSISESSVAAAAQASVSQGAGLIRVSDPNGLGSAIVRITSQPGCPVPKFISLPCHGQQRQTKEVHAFE